MINKDDKNCMLVLTKILPKLKGKNITVSTFSIVDENADFFANNISLNGDNCYSFTLYINKEKTCNISLKSPGKHNILNALATIATLHINNINIHEYLPYLEEFDGISRRFEYKKTINKTVKVYDDYAHHPTEITSTLLAAKDKNPNRIIAIFEPHTYTRTKALFDKFVNSFEYADVIILTKIYAAREIDDKSISSKMLVDELIKRGKHALYIEDFNDIAKYVKSNTKDNDIILTIGAGTITKLSDLF